jgi:hypothetical protein
LEFSFVFMIPLFISLIVAEKEKKIKTHLILVSH